MGKTIKINDNLYESHLSGPEPETQLTLQIREAIAQNIQIERIGRATDPKPEDKIWFTTQMQDLFALHTDATVQAITALFQQALTTVRDEMEKKKRPSRTVSDHDSGCDLWILEDYDNMGASCTCQTGAHNQAISECQKLLEDKLNNGGTQHEAR